MFPILVGAMIYLLILIGHQTMGESKEFLVKDEVLHIPHYKFAIVCIYLSLKILFASISRWVGNRIKGCYIVGLWYLSCWTTLASNLRFATAPNHGLWAWQHHRLFLVVGLARWTARIIKIPVILQKPSIFREINPHSGLLSQLILQKALNFSQNQCTVKPFWFRKICK